MDCCHVECLVHAWVDDLQLPEQSCIQAEEGMAGAQQAAKAAMTPPSSRATHDPALPAAQSNLAAATISCTPPQTAATSTVGVSPPGGAAATPSGDSDVDSPTGRGVQRLARSGIVSRSLAGGKWTPHIRDADEVRHAQVPCAWPYH